MELTEKKTTGALLMAIAVQKFKAFNLYIISMLTLTCMIPSSVKASDGNTGNNNEFHWPNGAKAAVSLSYDDALNSHLDNAIPALNKYGFKGTFYLTIGANAVNERREDWRTIARQGHELGNHTINHACRGSLPNRQWVDEHNDLDNRTMAQIKQEIIAANKFLKALDGQTVRTFSLPCADAIVEGRDLLPEISPYFVGIKSHLGVIPTSMKYFNPLNAPVIAPSGFTGQALIEQVKQAAQNNSIASFTFHGIGGEYLSVSTDAHQQLLNYLTQNKATYWVDTYRNISLYIDEQDKETHNEVIKPCYE